MFKIQNSKTTAKILATEKPRA